MSETAISALDGLASEGLSSDISDVGLQGMITIRGDLADPSFADRLASALGGSLPDVRRFTDGEAGRVIWMAPDELLLLTDYEHVGAKVSQLSEALSGAHALVLDMSDARAMFRITGDTAAEIIAKGAPVDLAPASFKTGDVRRTRLGQLAVGVWKTDDAPDSFDLICFRSVASHVFDWLCHAARPGAEVGHL